jgi:uncharacterized phage protein gp47/JayE
MAFNRPTLPEIISRIETDYVSRLGIKEPARAAFVRAQSRAFAGAVHGLYGFLEFISQQALPDTAVDEYLERWCSIFGIFRIPATLAIGNVTITGITGNIVPAGTILQTADQIQFETTSDVTLSAGTATANVQALVAGSTGNQPAGGSLSFLSPVAGINSNASIASGGITGGSDQESQESLRQRLIARIQTPPQGGNAADYEKWAQEADPSVTRVWVTPLEMGAGTVTVRFVTDDAPGGPIPTTPVVDAVDAYIQTVRPVTANVFVVAPVLNEVDFSIQLSPNSSATRAAVTAELKDLFFRDGSPGGTILVSRVREAISIAAGESDHVLISPTVNIVSPAGQLPVVGDITWS